MRRFPLQKSLILYVMGVIALIIILLAVEFYYVQPQDAKDRASFISTLGSFLGGGALLIGLFLTWQQLQINLDGQITGRITQAVDQIGSDNLSVRLGGLYALERIALDSDRDVLKIINIICAFIRVNSTSKYSTRGVFAASDEKTLNEQELSMIFDNLFNPPRASEDIQASLQILSSLFSQYQKIIAHHKPEINLLASNISGVNLLPDSRLTNLLLDKADADFIFMSNVNLSKMRANQSNFRGARLENSNLKDSDLCQSFFEGAILTKANIENCRFIGSRFDQARLVMSKAKGVNFNGARLVKVDFTGADLRNANLSFAKLQGASFKDADLTNATLAISELQEVDFEKANLKGVKLSKANLSGANLSGAKNLTEDQLSQTLLCQTTLSDGTISNRDCQQMNISVENNSAKE